MTGPPHTDLAAYVLGVLDESEIEEFERHLMDCPPCQDELYELHGLPDALDALQQQGALALAQQRDDRVLRGAIDQVAAARRRRRRASWLAGAAAAVVLVAVLLPSIFGSGPPQPDGETLLASNASNGVAARVTLQPHDWGTGVGVELRGVRGPLQCELVAVSKSGRNQVVTSWQVPEAGYGVPDSPEPLRVQGGASMPRSDLARLEFRTSNGPNILDVPV